MKKTTEKKSKQVAILLENIRSAENVGSIFRTSDAAGISHIYLGGYTPTPLDRFNRPNAKVITRSLGAEKNIPWTSVARPSALISKLKKDGWTIISIEQSVKAVDYKKVKIRDKTLFILGNEVDGVSKKILEQSDIIAEIPMRGDKESLNVSVATGVALFRMLGI
jgi:tRNA G18 (ribose-2'-O)-methylase SpoU